MNDENTIITSLQNDRVKELVRLRTRRARDRSRLTLIEEPLVISRALDAGYPLQTLYYCPKRIAEENKELLNRLLDVPGLEGIRVDEPVMDKISYREQAEGMLLVAPQLTRDLASLERHGDQGRLGHSGRKAYRGGKQIHPAVIPQRHLAADRRHTVVDKCRVGQLLGQQFANREQCHIQPFQKQRQAQHHIDKANQYLLQIRHRLAQHQILHREDKHPYRQHITDCFEEGAQ